MLQEASPHELSLTKTPVVRRDAVSGLLERQQSARLENLSRLKFSLTRCFVSLVSYSLLMSDVFRAGIGIHDLQKYTFAGFVEPDSYIYFGPYAYSVDHVGENMTDGFARYWTYKYDTTSIGMRAVARTLKLKAWSPCMTYDRECDERGGVPRSEIFAMLNALFDGVSAHRSGPTDSSVGTLLLRAKVEWTDRMYHLVFPFAFPRSIFRTVQVIHYDNSRLLDRSHKICGATERRPFACGESWTNYHRLCLPTLTKYKSCKHVDTIWTHISTRHQELRAKYPNSSVELLIIWAAQDSPFQSVVYHGKKISDVVTLFRVQDCEELQCKTIAVDDYRYETESQTTTVRDWFPVVAPLRIIGQGYVWLRIILLIMGCYQVVVHEEYCWWQQIVITLKTVFLIPSQVIIYGSVFPIACYVAAHLVDSTILYAAIGQKFSSLFGTYKPDVVSLVEVCSVSMRSVWVAAIVCHLVAKSNSSRTWSPMRGAPGIREFSLSTIASVTIFAHARAIRWRKCDVKQVFELPPSLVGTGVRLFNYDRSHSFIQQLFFGTTIDPQFLSASFLALGGLAGMVWLLNGLFPRILPIRLVHFSRTPVPHSAGALWNASALVISWNGAMFVRTGCARSASPSKVTPWAAASAPHPLTFSPLKRQRRGSDDALDKGRGSREAWAHANLEKALMNLAVMTDPLVFLRLRLCDGPLVGLYRSQAMGRSLLLPYDLGASTTNNSPIDWEDLELIVVFRTRDLPWRDLVCCGLSLPAAS